MREILFRAKRIDNSKWVYGGYAHIYSNPNTDIIVTGRMCFYEYGDELTMEARNIDPSTVGQYTGLTANGKKIFEGDILKITDEFGNSVIWSVDCKRTAFSINQKGVNYSTYLGEYDTGRCDIEIIGNIYDTPELFEVKE